MSRSSSQLGNVCLQDHETALRADEVAPRAARRCLRRTALTRRPRPFSRGICNSFSPRSALLPLVLGLLAAGTGCLNVSPPAVSFASEPPGARVRVDGKDSGWVTPCLIALDAEEEHVVTLTLDGHGAREVRLVPVERLGVISWYQAVNGVRSTIRFPLLQPTEDLLLPLRPAEALAPGRVFVRLRPESPE